MASSLNAEAKSGDGLSMEDKELAEALAPYIEMGASAATIAQVEVRFKAARQKRTRFERPGVFDDDEKEDPTSESKDLTEDKQEPPSMISHHVSQLVGTPGWYIHVTIDEGGRPQAYTSILQGMRFESEEDAAKPENLEEFMSRLTPAKPVNDKVERWSYHMLRFSEGISNHYSRNVQQSCKLYERSIQKVALIGTGILGTNIAAELCFQGIEVHCFDQNLNRLSQVTFWCFCLLLQAHCVSRCS
jgi:hypothetical protein